MSRCASTWLASLAAVAAAIAIESPSIAGADLERRIPPPPPPPGGYGLAGGSAADAALAGRAAAESVSGLPNLSLRPEARAAASSLLAGYPIHQVSHLRDGLLGNAHSWISARDPSWAEIDLGAEFWICQVAFGSDALFQYHDRAATSFSILVATEYAAESAAPSWKAVVRRIDGPPVHGRTGFAFEPERARWVRISIQATSGGQARIDEIEIFGQTEPIPPERIEAAGHERRPASRSSDVDAYLEHAFLGEEHAWLKTYGRADLSPRLVPYNGRVQDYPRHVGDDRLPLPPLSTAPQLDGRLDDACWQEASRGVARVAWPYDYAAGPLVECAVSAGRDAERLHLAIELDRILSAHIAVVSDRDGRGGGVVVWTGEGLELRTFDAGQPSRSLRVEGSLDAAEGVCEISLPLSIFPDGLRRGLRVGLGMGGKHTRSHGRGVEFFASRLAVAEVPPRRGESFRVRVRSAGEASIRIRGNGGGLEAGSDLEPGATRLLAISGEGPIGPEFRLEIEAEGEAESCVLNLFRYDPLERTLALLAELIERLEAKGVAGPAERSRLAAWDARRTEILSAASPDRAAERQLFFEIRDAKRRLFFRDPDLAPLERILFVKRHAFEP
ncbi:MAG: hypothetical protein JXA90_14285, partial [Planctomycetes bacterium]|nr:hypothetical protein [Planctomycetota bacterium]